MNIQVSAKAFTSGAEQMAHAAQIRKRLMGVNAKPREIEKANNLIADLRADLEKAEDTNGRLVAQVSGLELDLADLRASFMSQARYLAEIEDRIAGGDGIEFKEKKSVTRIVMEALKGFPGVTWEDVLSPRRSRGLIVPRHACIKAVCEQRPDLSFPAVGKIFHRDHTTILHAVYGRKRNTGRRLEEGEAS